MTMQPRMPGRNFLFVPGPTNVPDRVQRAMLVAMEDHRSSKFPELSTSVLNDLRKVFKTTTGQVFIFPSSGTGAWEAALTNTLSPGDKILAARFGQFSHLWVDMAERLGYDVDVLDVEWGEGVPLGRYEEILRADKRHQIKGVLACHNETATGVTSDIAGVRKALDAAKHPALLFVDTVSSLASIDYRHTEWGVDVAIGGSQKGMMLPPGLSFNAISQKAIEASRTSRMPKSFWRWDDMLATNEKGFFPYTPATNLFYGLKESLAMLTEEGLGNVFCRHQRLAEATRRAVRAWGLEICALDPAEYSATVTTILLPEGFDEAAFRAVVLEKFNMSLGAGLGRLAGKAFRIGHLGSINDLMLAGALSGVEMGLELFGVPHKKGGVDAALAYLSEQAKAR